MQENERQLINKLFENMTQLAAEGELRDPLAEALICSWPARWDWRF